MHVNLNVIFFPSYGLMLNKPLLIILQILDTRQELITRDFVKEVDSTTSLCHPLWNKVNRLKCIGKRGRKERGSTVPLDSGRSSVNAACAVVHRLDYQPLVGK